jgi:HSP20 family protein
MWYGVKSGCCVPQAGRSRWADVAAEHRVPVDVLEAEGGDYVIRASLPGFRREDVKLGIEDDVLSIEASRDEQAPEGAGKYLWRERAQGAFSRHIRLPEADAESVKAELKDGVLTIRVGRRKGAGKSIPVE